MSFAAVSSEYANGYLQVFINSALSEGEPLGPLALLLLFMSRMLPIISFAPFFGSKIMPNPVKVAFSIALFVIFLPKLLELTSTPIGFNLFTVLLMVKEGIMGFIIGLMISIPFLIVTNAGIIIDHQRGGASLMVNDPTIQNQSSPLGTLFNNVLIYLFFVVDGPFLFMEAILKSYEVVPPDQFISSSFFNIHSGFWKMQIALFNQMMVVSVQFATPALLLMMMTDLFLGIANRLAPQVQITFLGMALKSLLGLLIVCLGWNLLVNQFTKQALLWVQNIVNMLIYFKPPET